MYEVKEFNTILPETQNYGWVASEIKWYIYSYYTNAMQGGLRIWDQMHKHFIHKLKHEENIKSLNISQWSAT